MSEKMLMLRKAKKKVFLRQEAQRRKKLGKKWRQPKGMHSKMRRKFGGKRAQPGQGYRAPRAVRGLSRQGLNMVRVSKVKDVERMDPKSDIAVIARLGKRKKVDVIKKLLEKKIAMLNMLKPEEFIKKVEEELAKRKEELKAKQAKKKKSKEESLKKAEEKKAKEKEKTEEEKKEETEEEKRKILEKKE